MIREDQRQYERRAYELFMLKRATRRMLRALDGHSEAERRRGQSRPGDPESFVEASTWSLVWSATFKQYRRVVERLIA